MLEKHSAGDNIASHCTKCKLVLDHAIVAMDGETIAKVKCKTCGSKHKYRSSERCKKTRAAGRKKRPARPPQMLWETCIAEAKGKEQAYHIGGELPRRRYRGPSVLRQGRGSQDLYQQVRCALQG